MWSLSLAFIKIIKKNFQMEICFLLSLNDAFNFFPRLGFLTFHTMLTTNC